MRAELRKRLDVVLQVRSRVAQRLDQLPKVETNHETINRPVAAELHKEDRHQFQWSPLGLARARPVARLRLKGGAVGISADRKAWKDMPVETDKAGLAVIRLAPADLGDGVVYLRVR